MSHTIEADGPRLFYQKFVTIEEASGDLRTRIHAPKKSGDHRHHARLIAELLQQAGITDIIDGAAFPGLKAFDQHCIGGGNIEKNSADWGSQSLREDLGRDRPQDPHLENYVLAQIREWLQNI